MKRGISTNTAPGVSLENSLVNAAEIMDIDDSPPSGDLNETLLTKQVASRTSTPTTLSEDDQQPRALIYTTCYNVIDGVTLTIRKLEREILAAGGHVCVLTTRSGNMDNTHLVPQHPNRTILFLDNSVEIFFLKDPKDPNLSYHLGLYLSQTTQQELDDFNPSIVHITAPDITASHMINYARTRQIPLMGTYHSNIPEYMLFLPGLAWLKPILECVFRHFYNFYQALYVPTPFIRMNLIEEQKMDRATDVKIWGRGVDLERFTPTKRSLKFRENLNIAEDCPIVLFVGRLVPEKRIDIFIEVVKRLTAENINFKAVVVGAGLAEPMLEGLQNTIMLGWCDGEQLTEAYASSDVFLFPSSVETFGNVTLEAAASGLPLVVEAKCSGHLVNHEVNGYACTAGDVDAFYQGTKNLVEDAKLRESFSKESITLSKTLEQSFIVRKMIENYKELSDEFYQKYNGQHENRDVAYDNPDSFRLGKNPRPFGFGCFTTVFVRILEFVGSLLNCFGYMKERLRSTCCCGSGSIHNNSDDGNDIEMSLPTTQEDSSPTVQDGNAAQEDKGPGIFLACCIGCLDSKLTTKIIVCHIAIISFFFRCIDSCGRSCRRVYCCGAASQVKGTIVRSISTKSRVT